MAPIISYIIPVSLSFSISFPFDSPLLRGILLPHVHGSQRLSAMVAE